MEFKKTLNIFTNIFNTTDKLCMIFYTVGEFYVFNWTVIYFNELGAYTLIGMAIDWISVPTL